MIQILNEKILSVILKSCVQTNFFTIVFFPTLRKIILANVPKLTFTCLK